MKKNTHLKSKNLANLLAVLEKIKMKKFEEFVFEAQVEIQAAKAVEAQAAALAMQKEIEEIQAANVIATQAAAQATELAMQEEKKAADAKKALLEIEIVRHSQLQPSLDAFLANSMGEWCNEYLRQLATTAAQVRTLSDLATRQAELLKKSSES